LTDWRALSSDAITRRRGTASHRELV